MTHWIVIPIHNEAPSIAAVVRAARRHGPVLVVDDGSTDGSGAAAQAAGAEVLRHPRRRGKGAAIRNGAKQALGRGARAILTLDGDGQHDPDEIPRLLGEARHAPRAVVIGGRFERPDSIPTGRLNAARVAGFFINWLTDTGVCDTQSGFRVYPAEIFGGSRLRRGGFVLETESLLAAQRAGRELREVPITAIYLAGRRSRFRPVRDGCAVGAFLAGRVLVRLAAEGWRVLRRLASPFARAQMQRRHADLAEETAGYRATPEQWGIAVIVFVLKRAVTALRRWWCDPGTAQLRLVGTAVVVSPILGLLSLGHALGARGSADLLTRFIGRFYSQERLARARNGVSREAPPAAPFQSETPEEPPRALAEHRAP